MRILWLFFGYIGLHRFYKKYWISGIIMALTLGGFLIGWMIDGVTLVSNNTLLFQK